MAENLILYGFSGFDENEKKHISSILPGLNDSELILMEDAVIGSIKTDTESPYYSIISKVSKLYCLKEDLLARGLEPENLIKGIAVIDYGELIDLIEKSKRIISWL